MKFYILVFFQNVSKKFKINYNLTRITGTLHEYRCTFMIISRSVLLRMGNVSVNPLTPNDHYSGRTAPLASKVAFYVFIQQI